MAYTKIVENGPVTINGEDFGLVTVEFLTDIDEKIGGPLNYFHFEDLEKIKTLSAQEGLQFDGFRFGLAKVNSLIHTNELTGVLMLTSGKNIDGADVVHNQTGSYVAFSCQRISDQIGGEALPGI